MGVKQIRTKLSGSFLQISHRIRGIGQVYRRHPDGPFRSLPTAGGDRQGGNSPAGKAFPQTESDFFGTSDLERGYHLDNPQMIIVVRLKVRQQA